MYFIKYLGNISLRIDLRIIVENMSFRLEMIHTRLFLMQLVQNYRTPSWGIF